jgi:hypothetical protein
VIMTSSCFALQSAAAENCASRRAVVACLLLRLVFFFSIPSFVAASALHRIPVAQRLAAV